ncbi:F-box protein At3g07870-like [Apium graveolens]|uniref:F-box protein At3g07870-like n=1 Tax=Apium graveolens TaxID=4045 RepID=UPI003D7B9167
MESKRNVKKATITCIHESIIIHILCFLPAEIVTRCRSVCKNWATLISSPCFAEAYATSGTAPLQFLLHGTVSSTFKRAHLAFAHLAESSRDSNAPRYDCPGRVAESVLPDNFGTEYSHITICSVCNFTGFVVAYVHGDKFWRRNEPYHIFNPTTRQHIVVKKYEKFWCWTHCALLFAHKTKKLKLLYFFSDTVGKIQTIGTGLWRTVTTDSLSSSVRFSGLSFPCFLNGIYHWYSSCHVMICFNAETEVFHQIPAPKCVESQDISKLGVLDGCLCVCTKGTDKSFEFLVMNEYGVAESWTKKFVIANDGDVHTRIKRIVEPLNFLKNGEIVVQCRDNNLICYNPSSGNSKLITDHDKVHCHLNNSPIAYVPSFRRIRLEKFRWTQKQRVYGVLQVLKILLK